MIPLPVSEVLAALGARISRGTPNQEKSANPRGVSIDSRTLQPGECFCAIRGPRFDGHDFIPEAVSRGAAWVIHSSRWSPGGLGAEADSVLFLEVPRTKEALGRLGACIRRRWGGPLVAVTGSMGKTTTRGFAARLLERKFHVLESKGNLNNEFGVPLSLARLETDHEVAVLELGMNRPGEIERLSAICTPDIAVLTNVAPVHLEFFEDLEDIAAAKGEILRRLSPRGTLVFNADDSLVAGLAGQWRYGKISFAVAGPGDVSVTGVRIASLQLMQFHIRLPDGELRTQVRFAGRHYLYNLAAAAAVSWRMGLTPSEIEAGMGDLQPGPMRGRVIEATAPDGGAVTLWDDSYNSNPNAASAVLEVLAQVSQYGRKIAVLGEMLELGAASPELHRRVGREAARSGVDLLVAVGEQTRDLVAGAREEGMKADQIEYFDYAEQAGEALAGLVREGDLVLCKGSRGVQLDRVIHRLARPLEVREG